MKKLTGYSFKKSDADKVAIVMFVLYGLVDVEDLNAAPSGSRFSHSDTSSIDGKLPEEYDFGGWIDDSTGAWDYLVVSEKISTNRALSWLINSVGIQSGEFVPDGWTEDTTGRWDLVLYRPFFTGAHETVDVSLVSADEEMADFHEYLDNTPSVFGKTTDESFDELYGSSDGC